MINRKVNRSEHVAGEFPPLSRHNRPQDKERTLTNPGNRLAGDGLACGCCTNGPVVTELLRCLLWWCAARDHQGLCRDPTGYGKIAPRTESGAAKAARVKRKKNAPCPLPEEKGGVAPGCSTCLIHGAQTPKTHRGATETDILHPVAGRSPSDQAASRHPAVWPPRRG